MQRHHHHRKQDKTILGLGQKTPKALTAPSDHNSMIFNKIRIDVFPLSSKYVASLLHILPSVFTNTLQSKCNYLLETLVLSNLPMVNFNKWNIQTLSCLISKVILGSLPTPGTLSQNLKDCITACS